MQRTNSTGGVGMSSHAQQHPQHQQQQHLASNGSSGVESAMHHGSQQRPSGHSGIQFINETDSIIAAGYDGALRVYNVGPPTMSGVKRPAAQYDDCSSDSDSEGPTCQSGVNMAPLCMSGTDGPRPGKKTKGRVKIKMEFIENKLRRYTTFSKRKTGIMKKAYELSTLTGTQVMLLVASETGHVYTFATRKLQPMITSESGKALIQTCLNSPDLPTSADSPSGQQHQQQQPQRALVRHHDQLRMSAASCQDDSELCFSVSDDESQASSLSAHLKVELSQPMVTNTINGCGSKNSNKNNPMTSSGRGVGPATDMTSRKSADCCPVQDLSIASRQTGTCVATQKPVTSSFVHPPLANKNSSKEVVGPLLTTGAATLAHQSDIPQQPAAFYKIPGTNQIISLPPLRSGNPGTIIYKTTHGYVVGTVPEHARHPSPSSAIAQKTDGKS